jgi:hypothetical protein
MACTDTLNHAKWSSNSVVVKAAVPVIPTNVLATAFATA